MREKRKENSMFGNKEGKRKEKRRIFFFFFLFFLEKEKNLLFGLQKERKPKEKDVILLLYPHKCKIWMKVMGINVKLVHK